MMREDELDWGENPRYDQAIVCANGHIINSLVTARPEDNTRYCKECGEIGLTKCKSREKPLRRGYLGECGACSLSRAPNCCTECGKPHVWTRRKADAMRELLRELGEIPTDLTDKLDASIDDLLTETPRTPTATLLLKAAITMVTGAGRKALAKLSSDILHESAKKLIGLS